MTSVPALACLCVSVCLCVRVYVKVGIYHVRETKLSEEGSVQQRA